MTTVSGKLLAQGARHARVFALNSSGTPNGTSPTAGYTGIQVETVKGFAINAIEPRKFTHVGQDRPLGIDYLPPTEAMDGEIAAQGDEYALIAAVSGLPTAAVGEALGVRYATSKMGYEPNVGLMVYQKAIDLDSGLDRWRTFISAAAKLFFMPAGMTDNPLEVRYKVAPAISKKNLWGTGLTVAADGVTSAQGLFLMTEGKPEIISYLCDSGETNFSLVADQPALSAAKVSAWVNDTFDTDWTLDSDNLGITFGTTPGLDARVVIFYEW